MSVAATLVYTPARVLTTSMATPVNAPLVMMASDATVSALLSGVIRQFKVKQST